MSVADPIAARVERERNYHERIYEANDRLQGRFSHVFSNAHVREEEARHRSAIQAAVAGRVVLDYGCARGVASAEMLQHGAAHVYGIDLDEAAVEYARARGLERATFVAGDAHRLPWPDASFDVVVGRAILHHLDLDRATAEIARVLRPGGRVFFVEPIRHNPLGMMFRALTPHARTADEQPLSRSQIRAMDAVFGRPAHRWAIGLTMPLGAFTSLLPGIGPDNALLSVAGRLDMWLGRTPARWWMGQGYLQWGGPSPSRG